MPRGKQGNDPAPDRLLAGEDPDTRSAAEAARWLRAYDDLLLAKDQMIRSLRRSAAKSTMDAQLELTRYEGVMLTEQQDRLLRRQSFWRGRLEELLSERQRPVSHRPR
jgi:hypothetical protein